MEKLHIHESIVSMQLVFGSYPAVYLAEDRAERIMLSYGANPDGTGWARTDWGSKGSDMWEKAVFDMAGRLRHVQRPAFGKDDGVYEIEYV